MITWLLLACASCAKSPSLELPTLGTVGDPPPAAGTLTIKVLRDGQMFCGGATVSLEGLARLLRDGAASLPRTKVHWLELSQFRVLFEADYYLPVGALASLHRLLCQSDIAINQVFYSVKSESDGEVGALALFLPFDLGGSSRDFPFEPFTVVVGQDGAASDPAALLPSVEAFLSTQRALFDPVVVCEAAADVPLGFALSVVDSLLKAGVAKVALECAAHPEVGTDGGTLSLDLVVDRVGPVQRAPSIRWQGAALRQTGVAPRAIPRVRGRFAGVTESFRILHSGPDPEPPDEIELSPPVDSSSDGVKHK